MKKPIRKELQRCKACLRQGFPFLVNEEYKGVEYFYVDCEQCLDDVLFFESEDEAYENYLEKYNKVAEE